MGLISRVSSRTYRDYKMSATKPALYKLQLTTWQRVTQTAKSNENLGESALYKYNWKVGMRCPDAQAKITKIIKRVEFHLHPSFEEKKFEKVTHPPYQVQRQGYGSFTVMIHIFFPKKFGQNSI